MAFLTEPEFRRLEVARSATEITSDEIKECLQSAKDELIGWCGLAAVTEVEEATDTNALRTRLFRRAQQKLAKSEVILIISSRYRSGGIPVREKDANDSTGFEYEDFDTNKKRIDFLRSQAAAAVDAYILTPAPSEAVFARGAVSEAVAAEAAMSADRECCADV